LSTTTYTTVNGVILCQATDGVVHHFVPDPLGSVAMVRDAAGNTVYEAEYSPYGQVQSETGTNPSSLGFVGTLGYITDSVSSLYVRARYLLPGLGRWLTKDPAWPMERTYVYSNGDPVSILDPTGNSGIRRWTRRASCRFDLSLMSGATSAFTWWNPWPKLPEKASPGRPWPNFGKGLEGFPNYGNFCGEKTGAPPTAMFGDCIDAGCMLHDYCLRDVEKTDPNQQGCGAKQCNQDLANDAVNCMLYGCGLSQMCRTVAAMVFAWYGVQDRLLNPYVCCPKGTSVDPPPSPTPLMPPGIRPPGWRERLPGGRQVFH
jgi:RHS repeat-associated protein